MVTETNGKFLLIETSGGAGWVALAYGTEVRAQRQLDQARRHARDLAPTVRDLLRAQGWRPGEITAVFVSRGPGSYTGLRVGIMAAKVFAYATGCAILGIDTFAALALQAVQPSSDGSNSPSAVEVIADAQQEKVYVQRFHWPSGSPLPQAETALTILPLASWLAQLSPDRWVSGPGLRLYRDRLPEHIRAVPENQWDPQPASLLRWGLDRLARGERDDVWTLEPLYLRPSAAEEKWRQQAGGG